MVISRRRFLVLSAGGALLASLAPWARSEDRPGWLSCRRDASGRYSVCILSGQGEIAFSLALPDRGHAVAMHPQRAEAVVLARRPGTFMIVVDLRRRSPPARIDSPAGRHFYGHGAFDPEGRLLYVTENDFEAGTGVIGVYDAADGYRRVGEFASHGIGPHELKFLGDGAILVVANGGIRTHPDLRRAKLNLADMQPNLAYVNAASGRLMEAYRLPAKLHQLSIRHIDVAADDKVCIAMQYEGPANRHPPLVAMHRKGEALRLLAAPEPVQKAMRNYCGSVAVDASGRVCAVTSPRGGLITLWSVEEERFLESSALPDCCGVAAGALAGEFLVTNGAGHMVRVTDNGGHWRQTVVGIEPSSRWDNHLSAGRGTIAMSETANSINRLDQAKELAFEVVKDDLAEDYDYQTRILKEDPEAWVFIILPTGRVRGGGAQVTVFKGTLKVGDILYLQ